MLSKEALESAIPLTSQFDARHLVVTPIEGTPLEKLVNDTRSDSNAVTGTLENGFAIDTNHIEYMANARDGLTNECVHDIDMDNIIEVTSQAIQGYVTFAKTTVAAAVADIAEKTIETLNGLEPSKLLGMEVIVWTPPAPLQNSSLENAIRKFEEVAFDTPALSMKLPVLAASDIIALMKTGTSSLDKDIDEWAAAKGETFFVELWENMFRQKQAELNERTSRNFQDYLLNRVDGIDTALAVYLLSRKLFESPIEGTEMNLTAHENLAAEFRNQSAARLCHVLDELERTEKAGTLVRSFNDRTTFVNANVYKRWIEEGGDNDVLFGNLLTSQPATLVEHINAAAADLKERWNRHALLTATVENNRRFTRTKEVLSRHFQAQLRAACEEDESMRTNAMDVMKRFEDELDKLNEADISDIWSTSLKLVCRARFYKTDAERILSGIEKVKRENPNIDVRECAAVSVFEYISWWLSKQMRVIAA